MAGIDRELLGWPDEPTVYLTLDFECDFGTALEKNRYEAVEHIGGLVQVLEEYDVPLTAFTQTELLDVKPEVVEELRESTSEVAFHPHSHTHKPREATSIAEEVAQSTNRYEDFFGKSPSGYRFPNGNIKEADYELLADYGYEFDASIFPSWRPNHFDNTDLPTQPHALPEFDLVEIPFTVYSDGVRIPTALSYCRLLGRPFTALLSRRPPQTLVFNIHMHDLVTPSSYSELSPLYKMIYARNDRGFELLEDFINRLTGMGYAFRTIDELVDSLPERRDNYSR